MSEDDGSEVEEETGGAPEEAAGVDWRYAAEKLGEAVGLMMIPHGPPENAFAAAMHEFELAFGDVAETGDEEVDGWIETVRTTWSESRRGVMPEEDQHRFAGAFRKLWGRAYREHYRPEEPEEETDEESDDGEDGDEE